MRLHGEVGVQDREPGGKTLPPFRAEPFIAGSQLRSEAPKVGWPRLIVPVPAWQNIVGSRGKTQAVGNPGPWVGDTKVAADGSWAMFPSEPFGGPLSMNGLAKNVVYMTLDPPRTTVVPLPVTS